MKPKRPPVPATLFAAKLVHFAIGAFLTSILRWLFTQQSRDLVGPLPAAPPNIEGSLGFSIGIALAVGLVLLMANAAALKIAGVLFFRYALTPPIVALALLLLGGVLGTIEHVRGGPLL